MIVKMTFYTRDFLKIVDSTSFEFSYGTFLDVFRQTKNIELKKKMIAHPPVENSSVEHHIYAASLAATVEELCKEISIEIPDWVFLPQYILKNPYYHGVTNPDYQRFLEKNSLPSFKKRNIFVGDNVMSRV